MDFEQAHQSFLADHLNARAGERKGRLLRGHNHAEKLLLQQVWWPLFGNFDHLHPEYEIYDWNRKSQFLDFAFIAPYGRFGIECDGYQSHVKDMDREKFSYALNRDTYLTGMGWKMIHFSYDDVRHRPEVCRMLLQLVMSPYIIRNSSERELSPDERDVLRLAWSLGRALRPKDIIDYYHVNYRTARKWLQTLVERRLLRTVTTGKYTCHYELQGGIAEHLL